MLTSFLLLCTACIFVEDDVLVGDKVYFKLDQERQKVLTSNVSKQVKLNKLSALNKKFNDEYAGKKVSWSLQLWKADDNKDDTTIRDYFAKKSGFFENSQYRGGLRFVTEGVNFAFIGHFTESDALRYGGSGKQITLKGKIKEISLKEKSTYVHVDNITLMKNEKD